MDLTEENIEEAMNTGIDPVYTYAKQVGGYTEELFNTRILAKSDVLIEQLKDDLLYGEINIEKLNSGEEIIICAPDKIGYAYKPYSTGYSTGLENLSADDKENVASYYKDMLEYVVRTAESPFKVGDTLYLFLRSMRTKIICLTPRATQSELMSDKMPN